MLRKIAHLSCDHGKAAAGFTRARRFHGGIQRKNIGLEGNTIDNADNIDDLAVILRNGLHHTDGLFHHRFPAVGAVAGAIRNLNRLVRGFGRLLHGAGDLFHRRCGLLQKIGGFFRTRLQRRAFFRDLLADGANTADLRPDIINQRVQV